MRIRVYYEDTDCEGVVYHTNYIKFCERARSELFFQNNMKMDKENGFFVVVKLECNFLKSASLGDVLNIETKIVKIKKASVILEQFIYKDKLLIYSQIVTLAYLKNNKLTKIEDEKLDIFKN